ncbi:MAG: hypothetical protein D6790_15795 [Caldilineae bacterium]|nr:MAG: hypothetical protein D6790_15795 [Caldilineae bacterium]
MGSISRFIPLLTVFFTGLLPLVPHEAAAGNQPNWGAAPTAPTPTIQPRTFQPRVPARTGRAVAPARQTSRRTQAVTWEGLWNHVLTEILRKHPIEVAGSVKGQPVCQVGGAGGASIVMGTARPRNRDDLGISQLLVGFTRSLEARQYGEATRLLGLFQDRLLCLNRRGLRTLDLVMANYLHQVGRRLPPRERDMAWRGTFNPALLVLDQVLYTGRSWTLSFLYGYRNELRRAMQAYDGAAMGLWLFDYRTGALIQRHFDAQEHGFIDGLFTAIGRPGRFGNGACSIIEMAATGFNCGGIPGLGGGGGGASIPGDRGGMMGCLTQAALTSGMHGQLTCMVASAGGNRGMPDPTPAMQMSGGVLDKMCAMSEDGPDGGTQTLTDYEKGTPEEQAAKPADAPNLWQRFVNAIDVFKADDSTAATDGGSTVSPDGGSTDGGLRPGTDQAALRDFGERPFDPSSIPFAPDSRRTVDGDSGGCGDPTAAAQRMAALFNCSGSGGGVPGGSGLMSGQSGTGPRSTPAPGADGGIGGAPGGGMSGPGACSAQGGPRVQVGLLGKRCQQSMVGPGESCGPDKATAEMIEDVRRDVYSPNRAMTGAKDPLPEQGRTGTGLNRTFNRNFQSPALLQNQNR